MGHDVTLFASGDSVTGAELQAVWPQALQESVKNLGRYAVSWIAWWPNRLSSTAVLT